MFENKIKQQSGEAKARNKLERISDDGSAWRSEVASVPEILNLAAFACLNYSRWSQIQIDFQIVLINLHFEGKQL